MKKKTVTLNGEGEIIPLDPQGWDVLRCHLPGKPPQILIAGEAKMREWLGSKLFERLAASGAIERVRFNSEEVLE